MPEPIAARFTLDDAQRAADEWGANCGPGAIAGVLGMTLEELRPHLGDFEQKRYTNPTLMREVLKQIEAPVLRIHTSGSASAVWPAYGLARVQWEGPWTEPGVPIRVRYRRTHWIGLCRTPDGYLVFDINAMCAGGWISWKEWSEQLVPWLLAQCEPKASGKWHLTHTIEIDRASVAVGAATSNR